MPELVALVKNTSVDEIGLNVGAIQLWTLQGLGAVDGPDAEVKAAVVAALGHPSVGVRRNALQVLPRTAGAAGAVLGQAGRPDPDAQVNLARLLYLAEVPSNDEAGRAAGGRGPLGAPDPRPLARRRRDVGLRRPCNPSSRPSDGRRGREGSTRPPSCNWSPAAEHYARGNPGNSVGSVLAAFGEAETPLADALVTGLLRGWPRDRAPTLNEAEEKAMVALLTRLSPNNRGSLVGLANRWGSKGLEKYSGEIAGSLLAAARDESKDDAARASAARQLVEFRKADPKTAESLLEMITPRTAPALASGLVAAVAACPTPPPPRRPLVDRLGLLTRPSVPSGPPPCSAVRTGCRSSAASRPARSAWASSRSTRSRPWPRTPSGRLPTGPGPSWPRGAASPTPTGRR
ncbi:MAG: hypothetical protein U0835_25870 [Isosphaeraceae bacterium]